MSHAETDLRERRYRRHWSHPVGQVLIGLLGLAVVAGICTVADLRVVPWLPALALIPIGWLVIRSWWWRSTYLCLENGRLVFHDGPFDTLGQYINYNFGDWTFDQRSLWAKLWNVGTLRVADHTFEGYWPFRQLKTAICTPPARPAAPVEPAVQPGTPPVVPPARWPAAPPAFPSQPVYVVFPIRERVIVRERVVEKVVEKPEPAPPTLSAWQGSGYTYQGKAFEADHPSYAGFLAACEEFLFSAGRLDLDAWVSQGSWRRYYPLGMSKQVALFYRELLQRARIIDDAGQLYARIQDIEDIRQRVPYFEVPYRLAPQA